MGQSSLREPTGGSTTRTFVPLSRPRVPLGTKFMLSYRLGPHYFRPKFSTQPGKSKQHGSFIPKEFCWKLTGGLHVLDALTAPVFPVWEQPSNFQMPTSLQTACWKYRAQNNIFYQPEHSQPHPFHPKHSHFRSKLRV